jgi:signal transduction histidine kinase
MTAPRRGPSLRAQLLKRLIAVVTLVFVVSAGFVAWKTRDEVTEIYEDQVGHLARTLASVLDGAALARQQQLGAVIGPRDRDYFLVVSHDGEVVVRSPRSPPDVVPERPDLVPRDYYVAVAETADGRTRVLVGLREGEPRNLASSIVAGTALPMLFGFLAVVAAVALVVRQTLRPLERLRREISARRPRQLDPVGTDDLPAELVPMADGLNKLLQRLGEALAQERRFVADASHALRTPLTAIKAQAQTVDQTRLDEDVRATLRKIVRGVDRATRIVGQLLTLARADAGARSVEVVTDLAPIVRAVAAELFSEAVGRGMEIDVEARTAGIRAEPVDLEVIVSNLLENAILHAGEGRRVWLACGVGDEGPFLSIEDDGPGIEASEMEAVFGRFRRSANVRATGSGLGLSIVKAVADRLGARVSPSVSPALGGLRMMVLFPPPTAAAAAATGSGSGNPAKAAE